MLCTGLLLGQLTPDKQRAVEEATATLRAAVALKPHDAQRYRALAAVYTENSFHRTAAETLATAVQLAPTDAETLRLLGVSYLRSRQPEPAAAALRESIALMPSRGETYVALAGALEHMNGEPAEQEALLRSAVAASPQLQPAIVGLSRLLTKSGRLAEAEELLRGLLATAPHLATRLLFTNLILQSRNLEAAYAWRAAGPEPASERQGGVEDEWAERLAGATQASEKCIERRCIAGLSEALAGSHLGERAADQPRKGTAPAPAASLRLPTDPTAALSEVERVIHAAEPIVLQGAARTWPPFDQWTLEYLGSAGRGGSDLVEVTVVPSREVFEVHDDRIMRPPKSTARLADLVRFLNRKVELPDRITLYTRQATMWSMPELLKDVSVPVDWMRPLRISNLNLWLGDGLFRNTVHYDPDDNVLCLIHGAKHVLLFPPHTGKWLYYNERADWQANYHPKRGIGRHFDVRIVSNNTGRVNFAQLDLGAYPDVALALAEASYAQLHAGDCLYLPRGHHHHVFSEADAQLGFHLAVNLWFNRNATLSRFRDAPANGGDASLEQLSKEDRLFPTLHQVHSALGFQRGEQAHAEIEGKGGRRSASRDPSSPHGHDEL